MTMQCSWRSSEDAARFVEGLLENLKSGSQLTTTIIPEKSGGFCVRIVTDALSDVIDENSKAWSFYSKLLNT